MLMWSDGDQSYTNIQHFQRHCVNILCTFHIYSDTFQTSSFCITSLYIFSILNRTTDSDLVCSVYITDWLIRSSVIYIRMHIVCMLLFSL